jgi:hypothetical protein
MVIFGSCYVMDLHMDALESIGASRNITRGHKGQLFRLMLVFTLIFYVPVLFFVAAIDSFIIRTFIFTFAVTIICLMQQRLIAHMYMDLEYSELKKEEKQE